MSATAYETTVDGRDARVHQHEPDPQIPLIEVPTEDLCQLLAEKGRAIVEQDHVVKRGKTRLTLLESERDEIIQELAKRGDRGGQTDLFAQRGQPRSSTSTSKRVADPAPSGETIVAEPGEIRLALLAGERERGQYERIPQESDPNTCVCGALMDSPAIQHDQAHSAFAKSVEHELAPNAGVTSILSALRADPFAEIVKCNGKDCGAAIAFVISPGLKQLPIDATPIADGEYVLGGVIEFEGKTRRQVQRAKSRPEILERYGSHFRTCPAARAFSGRGKSAPG